MRKLYAFCIGLLACFGAAAQLTIVPGNGNYTATQSGSVYTLTGETPYYGGQNNGVWQMTAQSLASSFTVNARLRFGRFNNSNPDPNSPTGNAANGQPFSTGADGIAFVMAPSAYVGYTGEEMGYGTATLTTPPVYTANNSFAIEFDTWQNNAGGGNRDLHDMANDHMAFMKNGQTDHAAAVNSIVPAVSLGEIEDNLWHNVVINWNPATGISVTFDGGAPMTMSAANVISSFGGASSIMWGFNAATGLGTNMQQVEVLANVCTLTVSASLPALACSNGNVLYIGYGPQSVTAVANQNGTTFKWYRNGNPDVLVGTSAVFTPTTGGSYYVVATNGNCTASTEGTPAEISVIDVSCGKNKVYVCHKENGVHGNGTIGDNAHALCVSVNAVPAHLAHGDCLGNCETLSARNSATAVIQDEATLPEVIKPAASVYPNPSRGQVQLNVSRVDPKAQILVVNARGVVVEKRTAGSAQNITFDLKKYGVGVYLVKIISGDDIQTSKVVIQD